MGEIPLRDVCLEMQICRPTTRLFIAAAAVLWFLYGAQGLCELPQTTH